MYNLTQRANALFAFAITALFGLLGVVSVVTPYIPSSPSAALDINDLQVWVYEYANIESEFAFVKMKIEAGSFSYFSISLSFRATLFFYLFPLFYSSKDLTSLFNWNTKQLFICVVAEYNTDTHVSCNTLLTFNISWYITNGLFEIINYRIKIK